MARAARAVVSSKTVTDGWLTYTVDLSQYAGKTIKLQLENFPTGWHNEWAYWNEVKVVSTSLDAKESVVPAVKKTSNLD